jgi:hypothetical protein
MMKTNNKKKGNTAKKLLPAAMMLAVSASMLGTSTYAWFTMNKTVQVTGMEVRTKVSSNLLICSTNLDSDYSANTLSQTRAALLEPVSTLTGATGSFFYTTDAKANGSKNNSTATDPYIAYNENAATVVPNATAGKANYDNRFNNAYGLGATTGTGESAVHGVFTSENIDLVKASGGATGRDGAAYGYVDYTFYLKATSDAANQAVNLTNCDLDKARGALNTTGTVGVDIDKAWRVAVFAQDITSTNPGTSAYTTDIATAANQKGLISLTGAAYFNNTAVKDATTKDAITNNAATNGVIIDTIDTANVTKYYKVVVRLWLEGEDTTCNSKTYAALTNDYSLDLEFKLGEGTAIKNITTNEYNVPAEVATQEGNNY